MTSIRTPTSDIKNSFPDPNSDHDRIQPNFCQDRAAPLALQMSEPENERTFRPDVQFKKLDDFQSRKEKHQGQYNKKRLIRESILTPISRPTSNSSNACQLNSGSDCNTEDRCLNLYKKLQQGKAKISSNKTFLSKLAETDV